MVEGKKVIMRPLELGDEEFLYKWWNSAEVMEHATLCYGTLQSKENIRNRIIKDNETYELYGSSKTFLILKKEDMKPIGEINYCGLDRRDQKCEFGIKICEIDEQGKGYGQDALYYFIDFMFRFLNLNKIELTSMSDNKRAHNLYKKLGFKIVGVVREGYFDSRTGTFSDYVYMDLLKKEWKEIKKSINL